jgi:integral membrane sensor domain MASE1
VIKHFENLKVYTPSQKCMAILATTLAYLILGVTCLKLATLNENTSPFWLPAGLALGAISYFGRWASIGVFIGALLVNLTISPPLTSLFIASGNTLEAIVGSIILTQILKRNIFKQYSEFFGLFSASILGPIVGATIGTYTLLFFDVLNPSDFNYTWFTWWSGDFTGMLVISPLLLYWMRRKAFDIKRWPLGIIYFITLSVYLYFIFEKDLNHAYAWTICPLMILSGSLFGNFLSRLILFFISILIVILTKTGYGPFQYGNLNLNFLFMQSLLVCCSISSLFIELFESETKLPKRFLFNSMAAMCVY